MADENEAHAPTSQPSSVAGAGQGRCLSSNQSAVEAERRGLDVLNSQELLLIADLHGKEAGLTVAQVNLGYTRIEAPGTALWANGKFGPGSWSLPERRSFLSLTRRNGCRRITTKPSSPMSKLAIQRRSASTNFPGQIIHGKVIEIAPASGSQFALLPPDNATGNYTKVVQRIPVKIASG